MQRTSETEAEKIERRREQVREANRRYRARHRARLLDYHRQWRAENADSVRVASERWRNAHAHEAAARFRAWAAANPEKNRARKQRYRDALRAQRPAWPAMGELRSAALQADATYAAVLRVVPRDLPGWLRDDIISEVVLSILEGEVALGDAAAAATASLRRHRRALYRDLSLNEPAFEGGPDRIDLLRAEEQEFDGAE